MPPRWTSLKFTKVPCLLSPTSPCRDLCTAPFPSRHRTTLRSHHLSLVCSLPPVRAEVKTSRINWNQQIPSSSILARWLSHNILSLLVSVRVPTQWPWCQGRTCYLNPPFPIPCCPGGLVVLFIESYDCCVFILIIFQIFLLAWKQVRMCLLSTVSPSFVFHLKYKSSISCLSPKSVISSIIYAFWFYYLNQLISTQMKLLNYLQTCREID